MALEAGFAKLQLIRTRTRTNADPDGTEANFRKATANSSAEALDIIRSGWRALRLATRPVSS